MTDFLSVDTSVALNIHLHHARYIRHTFLCVPSTTSLLLTIIGASIYHNYIFSCFLCLFVLFSLAVFSSDKALWPVPEKCTGSDALWRFAPCNSKSIPHFNSTNYLAITWGLSLPELSVRLFLWRWLNETRIFQSLLPDYWKHFVGNLRRENNVLQLA